MGSNLGNSSWQAIAYHASIGDLSSYVSIGDTKGIYTLADFDHTDGSNQNPNTVDFITIYVQYSYWARPGYFINFSSQHNTGGYAYSNIRAGLDSFLIYNNSSLFDSELKKYIIRKKVTTYSPGLDITLSSSLNYIWLLTCAEVGWVYNGINNTMGPLPNEANYSTAYPMFNSNESRRDTYSGYGLNWLVASPTKSTSASSMWCMINGSTGEFSSTYPNSGGSSGNAIRYGVRLGKKS